MGAEVTQIGGINGSRELWHGKSILDSTRWNWCKRIGKSLANESKSLSIEKIGSRTGTQPRRP